MSINIRHFSTSQNSTAVLLNHVSGSPPIPTQWLAMVHQIPGTISEARRLHETMRQAIR